MILTIFFACLVACVSTAAFITLWFWVVRRELYTKRKAAEAAKCQLTAGKQAYMRARDGPKEKQARKISERSEQVYNQSAQIYNEALHKPWNVIPGTLMGFHKITIITEIGNI